MLNRYKYLILILAIIFLFSAKPAFAFLGIGDFGLTDIPDQILGGIEERTGPIFAAIVTVFAFYVIGLASLALSSNFLESFISQQSDWLAKIEPMTQAGWNFTAGLANMLLVLIFLIIAFAFIFKIETFQAKKALPKLIIVALLLNFSLLFVQILVDITQIIYNTILPDESLFATVMAVFIGSGKAVVISVVAWILALGVAWSIPFVNAFAQIIFSTLFTAIILPNIIVWAIQAAFFFLLSSMFLSFIFLFGARVFVIQILGILAPLAFLCLILPQTKSFWSQWFKFLLEWLLLGIFFLFFLVLGFGVVSLLAPDVGPVPIPGFVSFNLGGYLVYYFAIFIYMAVILFIGKKFIPSSAQALIDFGKGVAGTVLTRGLMPIGKGTVAQMRKTAIQQKVIEDRERAEATAKGEEYAPKFWRRVGAATATPVRFFHRMAGTTPEIEESRELNEKVAKHEKKYGGADSKELANLIGKDLPRSIRIAIASLLAARGDFNDLSPEKRDLVHNDALSYSPAHAKEFLRADPTAVFREGGLVEKHFARMGKTLTEALEMIKIRPKDIENLSNDDFFKKDKEGNNILNQEFLKHLTGLNPEHWSRLSDNSKISEKTHGEIAKYLEARTKTKGEELSPTLLRSFVSRPNLSRYIVSGLETMEAIKDLEQKKPKETKETKLYDPKGEKLL